MKALATQPREEVSLDSVLRQLAPQVRVWVFRQLGPDPDVDDVTQEALIQIADALARFEGRSSLTTYARRIAVRVANRHRKRRGRRPLELVTPPQESVTPERLAMDRESIVRLYRALDRLTARRRTAFVLCDIEHLSHAEAAEVEGIKLETLRARLKHARADLQRSLRSDPYLSRLFQETR